MTRSASEVIDAARIASKCLGGNLPFAIASEVSIPSHLLFGASGHGRSVALCRAATSRIHAVPPSDSFRTYLPSALKARYFAPLPYPPRVTGSPLPSACQSCTLPLE